MLLVFKCSSAAVTRYFVTLLGKIYSDANKRHEEKYVKFKCYINLVFLFYNIGTLEPNINSEH